MTAFNHMKQCMEEGCVRVADWRSEDGYPFCSFHGYRLYVTECELENLEPHTASMWVLHGRPHGPIGSTLDHTIHREFHYEDHHLNRRTR